MDKKSVVNVMGQNRKMPLQWRYFNFSKIDLRIPLIKLWKFPINLFFISNTYTDTNKTCGIIINNFVM